MLDTESGVLQHRAEEMALDERTIGHIAQVTLSGEDTITVRGGASDPAATDKAVQALVFHGAKLLSLTCTGRASVEQQRQSEPPNLDLLLAGFELRVPRPPNWSRQNAIHAVFLSPSGSASIARYQGGPL